MFHLFSKTAGTFILLCLVPFVAVSQSADDVLRYNLEYPSEDPVSMVLPGIVNPAGFGTYKDNPASMALFEESFFSTGLSYRSVTEAGTYLDNTKNFSDTQIGVGNLGLLFKFPTATGSLVVGAGYSQTSDFNRALSVTGRNNESTITDFYNITPDDSLYFAAFDVFAIDVNSVDSTESIFRIGLSGYPGIYQSMELTERGMMGELSGFFATEFRKNLFVGVSIGHMAGNYSYHRDFLESDRDNDYNFAFIDSDNNGTGDTDIGDILSVDEIEASFTAFSIRAGVVYQVLPGLRIGISYQPAGKLHFEENYNTTLTTTFDNGIQFEDDAPGRFSYKIKRPSRLKAGLSYLNPGGLILSVSAESVPYSASRIEFDDIRLDAEEEAINDVVRSNLNDVVNFRAGLQYSIDNRFNPRLGYAYYPSPNDEIDAGRSFYSGGIGIEATEGIIIELGIQYSTWNDRNSLYYYQETPAGIRINETVDESVNRWHAMVGLQIRL